jgi:hypothetical protein
MDHGEQGTIAIRKTLKWELVKVLYFTVCLQQLFPGKKHVPTLCKKKVYW